MKATKKQISFILSLTSQLPPEEVVSITKKYDLKNLSKKQASNLIKKLLEVKNHGKNTCKTRRNSPNN